MNAPLELESYDPSWPDHFEKEKTRIIEKLGSVVVAIEHIGSTSIQGIKAKNIVDVIVGIDFQLELSTDILQSFEELGYLWRKEINQIPGRLWFERTCDHPNPSFILHVQKPFTDMWYQPTHFRNYLRNHPEERDKYQKLKEELASVPNQTMLGYVIGKKDFIQETIAKGKQEAASSRSVN